MVFPCTDYIKIETRTVNTTKFLICYFYDVSTCNTAHWKDRMPGNVLIWVGSPDANVFLLNGNIKTPTSNKKRRRFR